MLLTSVMAWADDSGTCGYGVIYTFVESTHTLTISKTGDATGEINANAFHNRNDIYTVIIESGVTSIGSTAFIGCTNLTSVTIGPDVTSIGQDAFNGCTSLTSVIIGPKVTSIGKLAFSGCTSLTSVTIPYGVTSIGEFAFQYCSNLKKVYVLRNTPPTLGDNAFGGCSKDLKIFVGIGGVYDNYYKSWSSFKDNLYSFGGYCGANGDYVIWVLTDEDGDNTKETLTIAGNGVMKDYSKLEDRPWNNNCDKIQKVIIEPGVTSIGKNAFESCTSLTSVTIPASVTSISDYAFSECSNLKTVYVQRYDANDASPITKLGGGVFGNCHKDLKIYVPADGLDVYKAADNWKDYESKIKALQYTTGVDYLDWDDTQKKLVNAKTPEGTVVYILNGTETTLGTIGQTTWYVAKGTLDYTDRLTFQGDTHLILADDCAMTIGTETDPITVIAIECKGSITIYGQSKGDNKGKLTATSASSAIYTYDGDITINGGQVIATGIIGIQDPATGLAPLSYGIQAFKGNITINGGQVTAKGSNYGIISHDDSQNSRVTINGGQVTAIGGKCGISSQSFSPDGSATVATLTLGWTDASDYIMASSYSVCTSNDDDGKVNIAAGKRFVAYDPVGEGETELAASGIIGNATSTSAVAIDSDPLAGKTLRPLDGYYVAVPTGTIVNGKTEADGKTPKPDFTIDGIPHYIFKTGDNVTFTLEDRGQDGVKVDGLPIDLAVTDRVPTIEFQMRTDDINVTAQFYIENTGVDYLDWDDNQKKLVEKNTKNLTPAPKVWLLDGTETTLGTNGTISAPTEAWYIAKGNLSYDHQLTNAKYCDIHLILADGCNMTVGTDESPITGNHAICVRNANLTIYGQSTGDDMGRLTAISNNKDGVFIQSHPAFDVFLTINGGQVTAKGYWAIEAEITQTDDSNPLTGGITINGGKVTANGAKMSICASKNHSPAKAILTINGGEVYATINNPNSAEDAICLSGGEVYITGGQVEVNSKNDGIAISGYNTLVISGGQVKATGGANGYGLYSTTDITLGWTDYRDYIEASNYFVQYSGKVVKIAADKYLIIDGTNTVLGRADADYVLSDDDLEAVKGKKLLPIVGMLTGGVKYLAFTYNDGNRKLAGDNVQVYVVTGYDLDKGKVYLKAVEGNVIPKGMPVVIGNKTEGAALPENFFLVSSDAQTTIEGQLENFVSCDGTQTVQDYLDALFGEGASLSEYIAYVLTSGSFTSVEVKASDAIKKDVCLLFIPKWDVLMKKSAGTTNASTRSIGIGDGETTGIEAVENVQFSIFNFQSDSWYDLQGRRISKPTRKGLYIRNGKKVVM